MAFYFGRCAFEIPVVFAHEHVHAATGTTGLGFAAALIAEPGAAAVLIVEAIAVSATAEWAGLMLVGELLLSEPSEGTKNRGPVALGGFVYVLHQD